MSSRYTSDGKRKSSMTHARRHWDCGCGRRCWGNGGKASHRRACVVAIQDQVDVSVSLFERYRDEDSYVLREAAERHRASAGQYQELLNARVERERVA